MKSILTFSFWCLFPCAFLFSQSETLTISGLGQPVEIITDEWGVPHIYAQNEKDLFFAQGFYAARDRLFQFEVWRRQASGTVAEILGPRELKRDIGTRLFQFRGDITAEMNHYHDNGASIISSFVKGINAYIELTEKNPALLPIEFSMLGIKPQKWTPAIVISRHQGLLGNMDEELDNAKAVAMLGPEKVQELRWFHPQIPNLTLDPAIDKDLLFEDILELYDAYRRPIQFRPEDLVSEVRTNDLDKFKQWAYQDSLSFLEWKKGARNDIGSNNWIVSGDHTQSGFPMMANDPHRTLAAPSLRYMAHLVAPGWNVIGGGEPEIPGISIGHNEHGAWGLTVFETDAEDLYIYQTNLDNPNEYWYNGNWVQMQVIKDTIPVKGQQPVIVQLKYTIHGPVVYANEDRHQACAVRCGWLEIGGSPYLASLRMNQAEDFESFREACRYSHIPGENMVWADRRGNIGWQAVGIAPIRRNWSGLVPVVGDGTYEWEGYLPIKAKPNLYNPNSGIFATANANLTPSEYSYWEAIGFSWADPFRENRVNELLKSGKQFGLMDMVKIQTDYLSIPARILVPLLEGVQSDDASLELARKMLLNWDYRLTKTSVAAGIYNAWEQSLREGMEALIIPQEAQPYLSIQMKKTIDWLVLPDGKFGENPIASRDAFLLATLKEAVDKLKLKLGPVMDQWNYGQLNYKHVEIKHPLGNAVKAEVREQLNVGPMPRGGNSFTVNNTSSSDNQRSGASFRIIIDTGDWDHSLATNAPGQSGDPEHQNYRNLFELWANDRYFPLFYSKSKIESVAQQRLFLKP